MPNPQPIGTPTARNPYQTWCLNAHSGIAMKPTTSIQTAMVSCSAIPIILAVKHSFSPNPFPSSSDLPIWTHLMLRLARSIWMLEKYAKKKERQKIERKKWKKPWKEDVGSTASLHNENVQETHSQSFFFFFQFWNTVYTQIFSDKLTGLGSTKLGHNTWTTQINENVGDTCRWKFWTYVAKLIF